MDERDEQPAEDGEHGEVGGVGEPTGDGAPPADEPPAPPSARRYPSTMGGAFYLGILAAVGVGLWIVWDTTDWRVGVRVIGIALGAASALRLVLPARDAGMLAVRHRMFDVALLAAVGAALVFLASDIPDQPS